jgi:formylglycine-generating enzyme required for sulfatase activity
MALSRYLRAVVKPGVQRCLYGRDDLKWAATAFTGHFTFMWDRSFYDPDKGYTIDTFLADGKAAFGGYDTVVLWQAYPRIGADPRNQFDFYRDMPGGLAGLRGVVDQLHARGVKAFIAYNPWDTGTRREGKRDEVALAEIVQAIDADGVYLDTLGETSPAMRHALDNVKPGVVIGTELHPPLEQLSLCSTSWAQWLNDPAPPGMLHLKWIEPRHMQQQIRRWDIGHAAEIETAFFNGAGMVVWENVFAAHNPWDPASRALWKRAVSVLRAFAPEFTGDAWDPFVPTRQKDLHAHRWPGKGMDIYTFINTGAPLEGAELLACAAPDSGAVELRVVDLWNRRALGHDVLPDGGILVRGDVGSLGCVALLRGPEPRVDALLAGPLPAADGDLRGAKSVVEPKPVARTAAAAETPAGMVAVPGGPVRMKLAHQRRECGCYPDPGTHEDKWHDLLWGSPHDGTVTHDYTVDVNPFFIDEAQVTNAEFKAFLDASGYVPKHTENFLKHWPGGQMPVELADHPVVYVDLDDARAYAAWCGKRLPTEPEWQAAAQGTDGREWPWGNVFDAAKCNPGGGTLPVRALPEGRSPAGCHQMSGNVWEWTEGERDDGHTRFAILRGGSWFKAEGSGWYVPGGPQPCTSHAKFLLFWSGLDRCSTIGFRCVKDQS